MSLHPRDDLLPDLRVLPLRQAKGIGILPVRPDGQCIRVLRIAAQLRVKIAGRQPLADFSAIITAGATERYLYPTVYDFIALKASGLTQNGDATEPMRRALARSPRRSAPWFNWQVKLLDNGYTREDNLKELYFANKDCEASGIVLMELTNRVSDYKKSFGPIFNALKEYVAAYPQFVFINELENNLNRIGAKSVVLYGYK